MHWMNPTASRERKLDVNFSLMPFQAFAAWKTGDIDTIYRKWSAACISDIYQNSCILNEGIKLTFVSKKRKTAIIFTCIELRISVYNDQHLSAIFC